MSSVPPSLTVVVPGLWPDFTGIDTSSFPQLPALARLMTRADRHSLDASSCEQVLLGLFGVTDDGLPAAPFRYLGDTGDRPEGVCICMDPVHLRADTSGLILFDARHFSLTQTESQAIRQALTPLFKDAGWDLVEGHPTRWYLLGEVKEAFTALPTGRIAGQSINRHLPGGPFGEQWQKRLNEVQMLLHALPENQARAAGGQVVVNSVWLWGAGKLPEATTPAWSLVYSEAPLVEGLANWNQVTCRQCLPVADLFINDIRSAGRVLLHMDSLDAVAASQDFTAWCEAIVELEHQWLAPLLAALARGQLSSIELLPLNGFRYRINRWQLWRFWRQDRLPGTG